MISVADYEMRRIIELLEANGGEIKFNSNGAFIICKGYSYQVASSFTGHSDEYYRSIWFHLKEHLEKEWRARQFGA